MTSEMLPIFEVYCKALFFNYKKKYTQYLNPNFNNEPWHRLEWWFIRIGFEKRILSWESSWYDGNIMNGITLLGLYIGYGYSYLAKPATEELLIEQPTGKTMPKITIKYEHPHELTDLLAKLSRMYVDEPKTANTLHNLINEASEQAASSAHRVHITCKAN